MGPDVCAYVRGGEALVAVPLRLSAQLPHFGDEWRDVLDASLPVRLLEAS